MKDIYKNNIKDNALIGIANGIQIATNIVKQTLGAKGKNVILEEHLPPFHRITNDGATIIDHMHFDDPLEKRGLAFLKEVATRSNQNSGDGSTTTTIILNAILQEVIKVKDISPIELKKELDNLLPIIEGKIDEQTKQITEKDIYNVAMVAGESEDLAKLLQEIYEKIGKEGIIHLENSNSDITFYDLVEGVRFVDTGYLSPYMTYEEDKRKKSIEIGGEVKENKSIYSNPIILVTKRKIEKDTDIAPLVDQAIKEKRPLVIFTDDMDSGVASRLIATHRAKIANILVIKAPTLWKNYVFEDFAKITGSTIVEDSSGISTFKDLPLSALGTCGKIIVDKEETIVTGISDISHHIEELRKNDDNDSRLRLSWLQTKTAILRMGAKSETELSYLRLKAEDAINSCQKALHYGVVAGGGLALFNVSLTLSDTVGGQIVKTALRYPIKQIVENSGAIWEEKEIPFVHVGNTIYPIRDDLGFNSKEMQGMSMIKSGIIDASKVVKQAVRNAIGVASTLITSSTLITLPERTREQYVGDQLSGKTSIF